MMEGESRPSGEDHSTRDKRLVGADFVRASACLVILFHHLAQRMSSHHGLGFAEPFRAFAQFGRFGVAMFFVLSGFLLALPFWRALDRGEGMPSLRVYVLRRAARILPGFWLALIVSFLLSVAVFGSTLDAGLLLRFVAGFFLVSDWHWTTFFPVECNPPLWSIAFETTSYVLLPLGLAALFPFRARMAGRWPLRVLWLGIVASALMAQWLFANYVPVDEHLRGWAHGLQGGAKLWMPRYNPFGFFAIFAIGAFAAGVHVGLSPRRTWVFDVLAVLGLALAGWELWRHTSAGCEDGFGILGIPYGFPLFPLATALILVAMPRSFAIGSLLDNRLTRYLARISFGIYVWHYLVLELVREYWVPGFVQGGIGDPLEFVFFSAAVTTIAVAVATVSFNVFENTILRWARDREPRGG